MSQSWAAIAVTSIIITVTRSCIITVTRIITIIWIIAITCIIAIICIITITCIIGVTRTITMMLFCISQIWDYFNLLSTRHTNWFFLSRELLCINTNISMRGVLIHLWWFLFFLKILPLFLVYSVRKNNNCANNKQVFLVSKANWHVSKE